MTVEAAIFRCSICGEPSTDICVDCTKDACGNHRCQRCKRCSDCCECEVPLSAGEEGVEPVEGEPAAEAATESFTEVAGDAALPPESSPAAETDAIPPEEEAF